MYNSYFKCDHLLRNKLLGSWGSFRFIKYTEIRVLNSQSFYYSIIIILINYKYNFLNFYIKIKCVYSRSFADVQLKIYKIRIYKALITVSFLKCRLMFM